MKTLYVSDLDGTLLRSNEKTSAYTNRVINDLVKKGMLFSYATARSSYTSCNTVQGMTAAFPIIVYNGAFIKDQKSGELIVRNFFDEGAAQKIITEMLRRDFCPIVYAFVGGKERFSYIPKIINNAERAFIQTRKDERERVCKSGEELMEGDIFYISCIGMPEVLEPFFEKYRAVHRCYYQRDIYSGEQWLEIMPEKASKAYAVKQLAALLDCSRIIAFGDGLNDMEMFDIADECYAVENAVDDLKRKATAVILSNNDDGVAKWLLEHYI